MSLPRALIGIMEMIRSLRFCFSFGKHLIFKDAFKKRDGGGAFRAIRRFPLLFLSFTVFGLNLRKLVLKRKDTQRWANKNVDVHVVVVV